MSKPTEIHEVFRGELPGSANWAEVRCPIAMVPYRRAAHARARRPSAGVVRSRSDRQGEGGQVDGEGGQVGGDEVQVEGREAQVGGDEVQVGGDEVQVSGEEAQVSGEEAQVGGEEAQASGEEAQVGGEALALSATEIAIISAFAQQQRTAAALRQFTGYGTRTGNFKRALARLLGRKLIEMTRLGQPNSRLQQYRLITAGQAQVDSTRRADKHLPRKSKKEQEHGQN